VSGRELWANGRALENPDSSVGKPSAECCDTSGHGSTSRASE